MSRCIYWVRFSFDSRDFYLLPPRPEDAHVVAAAVSESLSEFLPFFPWAWDGENSSPSGQFKRLVQAQYTHFSSNELLFHLFYKEGFIGSFGFHARTLSSQGLELGYWVRSSETGKGLATAASRVLTVLAFDFLACERLQCGFNKNNLASSRVSAKVGFKHEGYLANFEGITARMLDLGASKFMALTSLCREDLSNLEWLPETRHNMVVKYQDF